MENREGDVLYYVSGQPSGEPVTLPEGYAFRWFSPTLRRPLPKAGGVYPFGVWYLFVLLGLFPRGAYRVLEVFRGDVSVHRVCLFPRFFRFLFMRPGDLQVGDNWTDPSSRGMGLATLAMRRVVEDVARPDRNLWGLIEGENKASIRVVEKCGFRCVARGRRVPRLGIAFFGHYVIDEWLVDESQVRAG
jgi:GNAT superfamily N-acetyltransferase